MAHSDVNLLSIDIFNDTDRLADCILSLWHNLNNSTIKFWTSHNMMVLEKSVLVHVSNNITTRDQVSNREIFVWVEIPSFVLIEAWQLNTSWDENVLGKVGNGFKRSLNTVENCFEDTCFKSKL